MWIGSKLWALKVQKRGPNNILLLLDLHYCCLISNCNFILLFKADPVIKKTHSKHKTKIKNVSDIYSSDNHSFETEVKNSKTKRKPLKNSNNTSRGHLPTKIDKSISSKSFIESIQTVGTESSDFESNKKILLGNKKSSPTEPNTSSNRLRKNKVMYIKT